MKCYKCLHYYSRMIGPNGHGYNPFPSCYLYEDTGRHPNVWTQECFEPRQKRKKGKKRDVLHNSTH